MWGEHTQYLCSFCWQTLENLDPSTMRTQLSQITSQVILVSIPLWNSWRNSSVGTVSGIEWTIARMADGRFSDWLDLVGGVPSFPGKSIFLLLLLSQTIVLFRLRLLASSASRCLVRVDRFGGGNSKVPSTSKTCGICTAHWTTGHQNPSVLGVEALGWPHLLVSSKLCSCSCSFCVSC